MRTDELSNGSWTLPPTARGVLFRGLSSPLRTTQEGFPAQEEQKTEILPNRTTIFGAILRPRIEGLRRVFER